MADGQPAAVLSDELVSVIGNMPLSTLANFAGMSLDHDALDRIAQQWQQEAGTSSSRSGGEPAMIGCVAVTDNPEGQAASGTS